MNSILGRIIPEGEKVDPTDAYGSPVRIVTEQSKPDKQDRIWDNVVDVLPAPSTQTASSVFG
jgi:hypothetical protein